jgi:polyisoprenyl-phosphate glycosyltransferase
MRGISELEIGSMQTATREAVHISQRRPDAGKISVVVPVYNSATSVRLLIDGLVQVFEPTGRSYEIVLVDDCSPDDAWAVLQRAREDYGPVVKIARLLKNSGQHNAILCGFSLVSGDIVVTMDDDLQNPPEEVLKLVQSIDEGYDLAIGSYTVKQHGALRNASGGFIDSLQRRIFGMPADFQLTSFRAIRRIVVDHVVQMGGVYPYITSMVFSHTSKYTNVPVRHEPRRFGRSNYNFKRSLKLSANLILSYSSYPLYFVAGLCFLALLFSVVFGSTVLFQALVAGTSVPGWASTIVIVSFFNALVLCCLLIFGIYLSRMNQQLTRRRVNYTIQELHD